MEYITMKNAKGDAHALVYFVAVAIPTEAFTAHTEIMLTDKDMAADSTSSAHLSSTYITMRPFITGASTNIPPRTGLTLSGYSSADPQRPLPRDDRLMPLQIEPKIPSFFFQPARPLFQGRPLSLNVSSPPIGGCLSLRGR